MRSFSRRIGIALSCFVLAVALEDCGGSGGFTPPVPTNGVGIFDMAAAGCAVSVEGILWYQVPAGAFSPIDVRHERCAASVLSQAAPQIPAWARPQGPTQAILVATSLQEAYSFGGMQSLANVASANHVPITWMLGNDAYVLSNAAFYNAAHAANGDDVEVEPVGALIAAAKAAFPWYIPTTSVEGAGRERHPSTALQQWGESAFWGITWDSRSVDLTTDVGAPWGSYCADPMSYKRPDPAGNCSIVAYEWTARDLTRAYLSGHDEKFSTDPDDLLLRAGFTVASAQAYERAMIDAYAAAGEATRLVVVSQQESAEELNAGDDAVMGSLYAAAVADGMNATTLAAASAAVRAPAAPRAIAFPFIPGGEQVPSPVLSESEMYPATIDYHDEKIGMTFLAGHLLPTRAFRYSDYPASVFNVALPELAAQPTITSGAVGNGSISLTIQSSVATRYGVALWSRPSALGLSGPGVTLAGRGGAVVTFDLQPGVNQIVIPCGACASDVLPYST